MLGIAVAGINSFALGLTGCGLSGKIGSRLHALAERVAIFREDLQIREPGYGNCIKKRYPDLKLPSNMIYHYMKQ